MKTKLLIISIAIALCLSATPVVAAPHGAAWSGGTANVSKQPGYGGEYTIYDDTLNSMLLSNSNYAAVAKGVNGAESFQSFCVERFEGITNPMEVWVSEDNRLLAGAGSGSHAYEGGIPGFDGDDLDPKTAKLYTEFALGTLPGYNYTPGAGRAASAAALQNVIWGIEEELFGWTPAAGLETTFYNYSSGWANIRSVRILQMTVGSEHLRQDQLYLIPVPAAVLLGILGLGVAGIKLRKYA